jgi:hypothetical protein
MKREGKSARAIIRGRAAASVLINWALEKEYLPDETHNPIGEVSRPSYKPGKEMYTDDEIARLFTESAIHAPELLPTGVFSNSQARPEGEAAIVTC